MMNYNEQIRCYVFQITGLCVGVPALCWAARNLHRHRRSGGKDSIFIITLLFNDALQLLLTLLFLAGDFAHVWGAMDTRASIFLQLYETVMFLGLWLHQLVALEGAVSVSHSKYAAVFSSAPCSVCVTLTVLLIVNIVVFFSKTTHLHIYILLIVAPLLNNGLMCFLMCVHKFKSHQVMTKGTTVKMQELLGVSLVTYVILYGPYLLTMTFCMTGTRDPYHGNTDCIDWLYSSYNMFIFRVIADCLLCVLVCRLPRIQPSQIEQGRLNEEQCPVADAQSLTLNA